jgi:hypothetical protein
MIWLSEFILLIDLNKYSFNIIDFKTNFEMETVDSIEVFRDFWLAMGDFKIVQIEPYSKTCINVYIKR